MLWEIIKTIILGIVEGVTEWLPISSTGHLILVEEFVKLDVSTAFWDMFLVVIQLGAILAVCVVYFHRLNPFSFKKTPTERKRTLGLWGKVILAVIPAAAIGLPINDWMEEHLQTPTVVAAMLIVYGVIFIVLEYHNRKLTPPTRGSHSAAPAKPAGNAIDRNFGTVKTCEDMSVKTALGIGLFQVLSIVPGTSRSGSTILGGMLLGCTREVAAEFSFFLAIPVMVGASGLRVVKFFLNGNMFTTNEWIILGVGVVTAFVVSVLAIKFLVRYVQTNDFAPFGWYRIVVGILVLAYFWVIAA